MKKLLLLLCLLLTSSSFSQQYLDNIDLMIENGFFKKADRMIDSIAAKKKMAFAEKQELFFRKERMRRILIDFNASEESVTRYIKKYFPELTADQLRAWEQNKKLEMKLIDGERKYFSQAARNLFRLDSAAMVQWERVQGKSVDKLDEFLDIDLPKIIQAYDATKQKLLNPVNITLDYTVSVPTKNLGNYTTVSAWLPYPRNGHNRQINISCPDTIKKNGVIAPSYIDHTSIYYKRLNRSLFNENSAADTMMVFPMKASYTAYAEYNAIDFDTVKDFKYPKQIKPYTAEQYPHIRFTKELKDLSKKIVGSETHKGKIVKKIFAYISNNYPWASAREYSTIPNIPLYCINESHGDCGIVSLLFITLCRYNGIPAKWQSGWMLHPGALNLHDWSEIYVAGKGWVPVDQSFGLQASDDARITWFYLGNTDAYHLIVNDDISKPFYPQKTFPRSETVDFQRGEIETNLGNLYFDEWDYHMDVKIDPIK